MPSLASYPPGHSSPNIVGELIRAVESFQYIGYEDLVFYNWTPMEARGQRNAFRIAMLVDGTHARPRHDKLFFPIPELDIPSYSLMSKGIKKSILIA